MCRLEVIYSLALTRSAGAGTASAGHKIVPGIDTAVLPVPEDFGRQQATADAGLEAFYVYLILGHWEEDRIHSISMCAQGCSRTQIILTLFF